MAPRASPRRIMRADQDLGRAWWGGGGGGGPIPPPMAPRASPRSTMGADRDLGGARWRGRAIRDAKILIIIIIINCMFVDETTPFIYKPSRLYNECNAPLQRIMDQIGYTQSAGEMPGFQ